MKLMDLEMNIITSKFKEIITSISSFIILIEISNNLKKLELVVTTHLLL